MKNPIVSVFMLAYNQEEFIAQAIESILMQKTNFPFQLVIGEDSSTDSTRTICREYAAKYPEIIKLLLNDSNLGLIANYVKTYEECTGKYVAICDGDDYWTDPQKLQKQVDILESGPEVSIVHTRKINLYPSGEEKLAFNSRASGLTFEDLALGNFIATVSVMFRNKQLPESMKAWLQNYPFGDWPTYLWVLADGGQIHLLDEITSVYRIDLGVSTGLREKRTTSGLIHLSILKDLYKDPLFRKRKKEIKQSLLYQKIGLMASFNREKKFIAALWLLCELLVKLKSFSVGRRYLYSLKQTLRPAV